MNTWPSIATPDWGLEEEKYRPQTRLDFEANYVQVYSAASRSRKKLPLGWALMSAADFEDLEEFFDANQGQPFTFTHPITSESLTCIFSTNSIKHKWHASGWKANVSCPIEEI